jgi:Fe(3+) dicitrate transport protein
MKLRVCGGALALIIAALVPTEGFSQTTENEAISEETTPSAAGETPAVNGETPAVDGETPAIEGEVPAVEIIQPTPEPEPEPVQAEVQPEPEPRPQPRPRPAPVVADVPAPPPGPTESEPIEPELDTSTLITQPVPGFYGPPGAVGAYERAMNGAQSPVNPLNGILPGNLQDFSEAGSRVTRQQINEQDPLSTNDILQRVPGVTIVNDDGLGNQGGVGIRGSNPRRSRKVLVMEDGQSINMSLYIDPSVHYVPPPDRIEAVEVIKGSIIYAPNNNFGAINFRNIQPFGPNETVVSGEGGAVSTNGGSLDGNSSDDGSAAKWHVHNRQTWGNWGAVVSYTGANVQGAWDTERLRYNDFYAALGWQGTQSDFVFSAAYMRQRDNYDEANLEFEEEEDEEGEDDEDEEEEEEEEGPAFRSATVEQAFFNEVKHCKTCFNPGSRYNTYSADPFRLQGVYNYYFDPDTTSTSRIYYMHHRRDRYQNFEGANPMAVETDFSPLFFGDDVLIPEGVMLGRLRTYQHIGGEQRFEFANRPFLSGLSQDLQTGVRFERHTFANRNFLGDQGEILEDGDKKGLTVFDSEHEADAISAYVQTVIHATPAIDIVPGIRFEHFNSSVVQLASSEEEGEGEELEECEFEVGDREFEFFDDGPCAVFGVERDIKNFAYNKTYWLPGISFSWGLFGAQSAPMGKSLEPMRTTYHTTMYGGYNRGVTIPVQREGPFPPEDELGDNYQLGIRSTGIRGVTLDMAGFYKQIQNYQIRGAATTAAGNNVFTSADEVEIPGVEMYARLDSRPFTGWKLNPYGEATFTYAAGEITAGVGDGGASIVGNRIPFAPREVAYLTTGIESTAGWNASVSFVYRGDFYTDAVNTPFEGDPSGENGLVPSVWLLNARANFTVPQSLTLGGADMALFISGQNLTNKLYITDREDGVKPGLGRSLMAGARVKW